MFESIASACGEPVYGSSSFGSRTRASPDSRRNAVARVNELPEPAVANAKHLIGLIAPAIRTDGRPDAG